VASKIFVSRQLMIVDGVALWSIDLRPGLELVEVAYRTAGNDEVVQCRAVPSHHGNR